MKRIGHLFDGVVDYGNLLAAARKAMKGCGPTDAVCRFFFHLERDILTLQRELAEDRYRPAAYDLFYIHDPKKRLISVAPFRDRVVHHAVVGILTPIYERVFIHDSYATRPGKGTHAAIQRARRFIRRRRWYLKLDVEHYFETADHDVLMAILERKLKDRRLVSLLDRIVRNETMPGKGLPIGNLTSQFLANVYLDPLDHEIKDRMGARRYIRYMDDMVFFDDDKETLKQIMANVESFLTARLKLRLKPSATRLQRCSHGLSFLGMRIFPNYIRVKNENRRRSLKRARQAVLDWQSGAIEEALAVKRMASIIGHLRYFCPNADLTPPAPLPWEGRGEVLKWTFHR